MGNSPGHGTLRGEQHNPTEDLPTELAIDTTGAGLDSGLPGPIRMLLIEDSQDDVALTRRAFKSAAPHVAIESVARGKEAIERVSGGGYDVAVLDLKLPDMDGIAVLEAISGQLPVVVTTGRGDERLAVTALKAGAVDYLVKDPAYLQRLPHAITAAVRAARLGAENRRLARETERHTALLRAVMQADPGGICVFRGPEMRIEVANDAYRRLVPHWGSDLEGKRLADVSVLPEYAGIREAIERVYARGESFEVRDLKSQHLPQPRYFDMYMTQLNGDAPDEDRGVLVVAWDTTSEVMARQQAEELARRSEAERAWLQKVIDYMPEGVVLAGPDGAIRQLNRAATEILGASPASAFVGGLPRAYTLTAPDGTPLPDERLPLVRAIQNHEVVTGEEVTGSRADGTLIDLLCNAAPLFDSEGKLTGGVLVFQDITALKDVERMKDEFVSVASHELRTPLASVKATAQFLLRKVGESSEYTPQDVERLEAIVQQSSRMARLIEELLDVGRLQSGRIQIDPEPFELSELVRETVEAARYTYPQCAIEIHSERPIQVMADRDRIGQVLTNLLDNAVKYSAEDCRVDVSLSAAEEGSTATLQVRDHGVGFDPDDASRLFERFSRLGPLAHHSRGMGLGLFISKQIVDSHGGTISAHSEGPNRGATVTVVLPVAPQDAPGEDGQP